LEQIFTRYRVLRGQEKDTVVPVQAMKAHKGRRGRPPLILHLALDSTEWSVSCPSHINPEKEPQYMLNRELDGPLSQSGWLWTRETLLPFLGFEADCPVCR